MMNELSEEYLRGVELFNAEKFFECHEGWEVVWLKAEGEEREFLHAMIQAAAALHHVQRGNWKGARSVGQRAIEKLAPLTVMMRLDVQTFRASLDQFLNAGAPLPPHLALAT